MTSGALAAWLAGAPSLAPRGRELARAAASEAPILLLGEAGTGRTALVRALVASSARAAGPLVEVDPGALPAALFESELFGHRAGAFTGADRDSAGRVERARGGTLVIDHVEELPLPAQPKLLRLLSERRFAPLGGAELEADVRFLAVGAEDLTARVASGAFREDLYYRLEVLTFRLPPLRTRPGDVPALAAALLADLAERFTRPGLELAERALAWMTEYSWPGNARQMKNLLERELLACDDEQLDPPPPVDAGAERPRSLADVEAAAIRAALAYTRGHQERAAGLLGVSRKGLWEKRRRFGIP